jgi:HlyD family secretion protein
MKVFKIIMAILAISTIVFLSLSCSSNSSSTATTTTKTATVQKGDISVSITGTGNLTYSTTEDLAFEVPGFVESVSVEAGDTVEKDQEIAKVDTSEWEKTLKTYQSALTKSQRASVDAQATLASKQRDVTARELAVEQAQLDLQSAEYNLNQIADVKSAQANIDSIQNDLDLARSELKVALAGGSGNTDYIYNQISSLQTSLDQANQRLQNLLNGKNMNISSSVALQISQMVLGVKQKQETVNNAQAAVETANTAVSNAQLDLTDAGQAVKDTQSDLDEANTLSPIMKAPFTGIITNVNVKGGDEVKKGTIAAVIADPNQFEANISVTENDIFSVILEETAEVSLDALSDVTYPAKVTYIAPTATVNSGVVTYSVTVTLTSLQPIARTFTRSDPFSGTLTGGTAPSGTPPAMPSQGTTGVFSTPVASGSTATAATGSTQTVALKKGLSATVEIISEQASDVLIIPSKAIKTQGRNTTVQVINGTATETRIVKTGITDGTNTEITEGLSEKEQVSYTVSTSGSSSTSSTNQQGGMPGMGGMGGIGGAGGPPGGF